MATTIFAHDLATTQTRDIALHIDLRLAGDAVDIILIEGLPSAARLSAGKRDHTGAWRIPFAGFNNVKLSFDSASREHIVATVKALDSAGTELAADSFQISVVPDFIPASLTQKAALAIALIVSTAAVFICWRELYNNAQDVITAEATVTWAKPTDIVLRPGPPTFWFEPGDDVKPGMLHHRGPIDPRLKLELLNLARIAPEAEEKAPDVQGGKTNVDSEAIATTAERRLSSYHAAIDQLAFKSNERLSRYFLYLLSIAGLSGILGTQIRAFADFIHLSARRNELDVSRWWTWYAMRPFLGFLLGLVAVLIVEAKLFVPTDAPPSGTVWWMAIAMLVGFASDDFAQRLRLIGQAMFGRDSRPDEGKSSRRAA